MNTKTTIYIFFIVLILGFSTNGVYGEEFQKKVLFVEGYAGEETSIESFKDIGSSNFASALRQEGYAVQKTSATKGLDLEAAEVIVINRPYRTIPESEIDRLISFVENGGGILLIGDNYKWEIDPVINPLSSNFGIGFNGNILAEPIENTKDDVHNLLIKDFSTNPVTSGLEVVGYFTGGYLTTSPENILASTTKESWIDTNNNGRLDGGEPYNKFAVIVGTEFRRGRVVAIGDGTLFENLNFGNYDSDKLAINTIKWLAGDIAGKDEKRGSPLSGLSSVYKYSALYILLLILITLLLIFSIEEGKKEFTKNLNRFISGILVGGILGGLIESGNLPYFSSLVAGGISGNLSAKKFTHNSHVIGAIAGGFSAVIGVLVGYIIAGKVSFSFINTNPLSSMSLSLFLGVISGAFFGKGKKEDKS